ncbi:uncharacterized protein LOC62_03G004801 [Vanrija pseudolonga]|uniref:FAS1 domain-containing protein n=1 Tax=Vanrija pseudolonga TaxID=143232 RepID=A0AAF0Y8D8_9TREE|nr:hypothetical protein LOC62_03G004801 [Vanrija pseudolonga]
MRSVLFAAALVAAAHAAPTNDDITNLVTSDTTAEHDDTPAPASATASAADCATDAFATALAAWRDTLAAHGAAKFASALATAATSDVGCARLLELAHGGVTLFAPIDAAWGAEADAAVARNPAVIGNHISLHTVSGKDLDEGGDLTLASDATAHYWHGDDASYVALAPDLAAVLEHDIPLETDTPSTVHIIGAALLHPPRGKHYLEVRKGGGGGGGRGGGGGGGASSGGSKGGSSSSGGSSSGGSKAPPPYSPPASGGTSSGGTGTKGGSSGAAGGAAAGAAGGAVVGGAIGYGAAGGYGGSGYHGSGYSNGTSHSAASDLVPSFALAAVGIALAQLF